MGSSTKVLLPIALLFAVIFGITFISNNTNTAVDPVKTTVTAPKKREEPLIFPLTTAEPDRNSTNLAARAMTFDWEVGHPGHFDFWFRNPTKDEVQVYLQGKNCTCAGAQFTAVPREQIRKSLQLSALGSLGGPTQTLAMLPFAAAELTRNLPWQEMSMENDADGKTVPGTIGDEPQLGILRVTFNNSKQADQRRTVATIIAQAGKTGFPAKKELSVVSRVGGSIMGFVPYAGGPAAIDFGSVHPRESSTREIYLFSFTRDEMALKLAFDGKDDAGSCLSFATPVRIVGPEFEEVVRRIDAAAKLGPAIIKSIYKSSVTLRERVEDPAKKSVTRMEMGPFEKTLVVQVDEGGEFNTHKIQIRGTIRGELSIVSGTDDRDRIDFGKSVNAQTGDTRRVEVRSSQTGLDAELLPDMTSPAYLQVEMSLKGEEAGKKTWNLTVRIPPRKLNGAFPTNSAVILRLKDGSNQRIRIPVIGQAVEGGRQL